jgi:hypothetical protein
MKEDGGELYFEQGEILFDGNEINDKLNNKIKKGKMLAENVTAQLLKRING